MTAVKDCDVPMRICADAGVTSTPMMIVAELEPDFERSKVLVAVTVTVAGVGTDAGAV